MRALSVTELKRRIVDMGLRFSTIPKPIKELQMPQANDKTVRMIHEITDSKGNVLTRITAESFNFNWTDITEFQQRAVRPVAEAMFAMGAEYAKAEASGG